MKKISILLFVLLLGKININAQQNKPYVEVCGTSTYKKNIKLYKATVVIVSNYNNEKNISLEEIKEAYFRKLEKIGIRKKQLKENPFEYGLLGYEGQGTIYKFETPSKDLYEKFLLTRTHGVFYDRKYIDYSLDQEVVEIEKNAIDDARKKAEKLAEKLHKKIGKILSVKNTTNQLYKNNNEALDYYTYFTLKPVYTLTVSFELMDK